MIITEFLQNQVPFLKGLTDEQARELASAVEERAYKSGQTIVFKGATVDGLHVIAAGKVSVCAKAEKNSAGAPGAVLGPGDVFGERSIVEITTAKAAFKGAAPETLLFVIPQRAFVRLLQNDTALKFRVYALLKSSG
ncbi:MAG TPA: hypothetical protein DCM05_02305 [Elusimicrobia bacterium]|nr:hypothetical protein [Elusimicrobiota bacterium]